MSTATLTVKTTGRASSSAAAGPLSFATSSVGATSAGDVWPTNGKEMVAIYNGSGSSITVTLVFGPGAAIDGQTPSNETISVAAGDTVIVGPFPATPFKDATNNVTIHYSAVTSVKVMAFQPASN